jgi:two-component system sensor histidine kinase DesK
MAGLVSRTGWLSTTAGPLSTGTPASADAEAEDTTTAPGIAGGPKLARAIVLAVLCSYGAVQVIDALTSPLAGLGAKLALDIACLTLLLGMTASVTSAAAERWPRRRRLAMLLAEALVTYLPMLVLLREWAGMAGFFAGSALLLLSGGVAWILFGAAVGSMLVIPLASHLGPYATAYLALSTLVLGLVIFGLARLAQLVRYVYSRRGELAQLAVMKERTRFARDLHDLLGYSLSAITLKAELTRRLVGSNPAGARDELSEVIDIARQALADTRLVAHGYRNINLAKEASSAAALLADAGISARVEINCGPLDETVDTVLAIVLREAVTNMLRHSAAQSCSVEAEHVCETIRLRVVNDGVLDLPAVGSNHGGLENITARLETIGGRMTAKVRDGHFDLIAEVPSQQAGQEEMPMRKHDNDQ